MTLIDLFRKKGCQENFILRRRDKYCNLPHRTNDTTSVVDHNTH